MPVKRTRGRPAKSKDDKLKAMSVQLHDAEIDSLKRIAERDERSVSYVIRRAVLRMLDNEKGAPPSRR